MKYVLSTRSQFAAASFDRAQAIDKLRQFVQVFDIDSTISQDFATQNDCIAQAGNQCAKDPNRVITDKRTRQSACRLASSLRQHS